jgi:nicotinamidase-related amidase
MPVTTVDATAALIVVDLQKGVSAAPTVPHAISDVIRRSAQLSARFRTAGLPVALVNVTGVPAGRTEHGHGRGGERPADWAELVPELGADDGDLLISKQRWSAFPETYLDAALRHRSVTQVFVTGVATSAGVESTARSAFDLGYDVVIVNDAVADLDEDNHRHTLERIVPLLGEQASTADVLTLLEGAFS